MVAFIDCRLLFLGNCSNVVFLQQIVTHYFSVSCVAVVRIHNPILRGGALVPELSVWRQRKVISTYRYEDFGCKDQNVSPAPFEKKSGM